MQVLGLHSNSSSTCCNHTGSSDNSRCQQPQPEDLQQQQPEAAMQPALQPQDNHSRSTDGTQPSSRPAAAAAGAAAGLLELGVQQGARWAIDVGACPGGWSSYLADSCGYSVIAIDPAELHPDVKARPGVHHIKAKAADALESIDQLLQGQQVRHGLLDCLATCLAAACLTLVQRKSFVISKRRLCFEQTPQTESNSHIVYVDTCISRVAYSSLCLTLPPPPRSSPKRCTVHMSHQVAATSNLLDCCCASG